MRMFLIVIVTWFFGSYWYNVIKDMKHEKIWIKEYNKIYSTKNPEKVSLINDYYDCLSSSKSVIEGCDRHVAKGKLDTATIHEYLNGLKQYVDNKKKD